MGIGVTSHSSSIEEAQADRVRRRAERDGLKRTHPPEEPAPAPGSTEAAPDHAPTAATGTVATSSSGRAGTGDTHTHQSGRVTSGTALAPPPGVVSSGTEPALHDRPPSRGAHPDGIPGQTATPSLGGGGSTGVERAAGAPTARPVPPPPGLRTSSAGGQPARPAAAAESAGTRSGSPSTAHREAAQLGSQVPQARSGTAAVPPAGPLPNRSLRSDPGTSGRAVVAGRSSLSSDLSGRLTRRSSQGTRFSARTAPAGSDRPRPRMPHPRRAYRRTQHPRRAHLLKAPRLRANRRRVSTHTGRTYSRRTGTRRAHAGRSYTRRAHTRDAGAGANGSEPRRRVAHDRQTNTAAARVPRATIASHGQTHPASGPWAGRWARQSTGRATWRSRSGQWSEPRRDWRHLWPRQARTVPIRRPRQRRRSLRRQTGPRTTSRAWKPSRNLARRPPGRPGCGWPTSRDGLGTRVPHRPARRPRRQARHGRPPGSAPDRPTFTWWP